MTEADSSPFVRGFAQLFPLTPAEREHLAQIEAEAGEAPARRTLIEEGRTYDFGLVIRAGWMIEYKLLRSGKRQILNFRLPGEMAGIDCLAYSAATHSVAALSPCSFARLPLSTFEALQHDFPRLASGLFFLTLRKEAILNQWEVSLGRRDALARVAHLFLELHARLKARGLAQDDSFLFPATQEDIADCVGLTTPYVNRILQRLRADKLIEFDGRRLTLLKAADLAKTGSFRAAYVSDFRPSLALGGE